MTTYRSVGTGVVLGVLATVAIAFVLVAAGEWRQGLGLAGMALGFAGVLRLTLSSRMAGALRVRRSRVSDAGVMLALGIMLVVLAVVVPDQPPAR